LSPEALVADLNTMGFLFEALCLRDLAVYSATLDAAVHHFRDESGLEADAIIVQPDGSWTGVEIKLGANQIESAAKRLLSLSRKLTSADERPPAALIVIVGVGAIAHRRNDGVCVVPIDLLGP